MRRMVMILTALMSIFCLAFSVEAVEKDARDISSYTAFWGSDLAGYDFLTDGVETEGCWLNTEMFIRNKTGMASLYLVFDAPCSYRIRDTKTGKELAGGEQEFLHVCCDLKEAFGYVPESVVFELPEGGTICEIRVFAEGKLPSNVQVWNEPLTGAADIVLFSTHGDDEQLYFAGLLPYYAGELGLDVQVVYMTDHANNYGTVRQHEMLNGLWAVGVKAYPVFGYFPDFKMDYREETYVEYENLGYSRVELLQYVVENLRRFRPQVAVGHDLNGEYGHGMHKVYADLLTQAVQVSGDPDAFPESANRYGAWDVPKTYLHLYRQNEIVMDWDQPLGAFGGLTAFQVNQKLGFPCHVTQQYDQYVNWLYGYDGSIVNAAQIRSWSPCYYGLYRSTVGEDVVKNDLMENLTPYAQQRLQQQTQDQQLRSVISEAREASAQEPQLLREPPAEPEIIPASEPQAFPVGAIVLAVFAVAAMAFLYKNKNFQKK